MLVIYRLARLIIHLLMGVFFTVWYQWVLGFHYAHPRYQKKRQYWLKKIALILGIAIQIKGQLAEAPIMVVANHVSWLDIPLLGSITNPRFLSKDSIKKWPLIGWLATTSGTLYIKRGHVSASIAARNALVEGLKTGHRVLIFPEGTTSSGKWVKRFYSRLYAAAIDAQVKIQPVAIIYKEEDGSLSHDFPYINQQSLWCNLLTIITKRGALVEIHLLKPINTKGKTRRELAENSQKQINEVLASLR